MDAPVVPTGHILGGKYELLERIGQGASARVFRARQLGMERDVALKIFFTKETALDSARSEVSAMAQLRHPNTVTVHDHGEEGEWLYLVMEMVQGGSLRELIRRQGRMRAERAVDIILAVLGSLQEAHHIGLLHLDIKPENILMGRDFSGELSPKVTDFGISMWIKDEADRSEDRPANGFMGTPRYCAPEQIFARPLSPATDLYNVGLVLWFMLQGTHAVGAANFKDALLEHLSRSPWQLPQEVEASEGLRAIVHKALLKSPEERYASCEEMIRDLKQWQAQSGELNQTISLTRGAIELLVEDADEEPWMFTPQDIIDPNVESMVSWLGLAESSASWLSHETSRKKAPPALPRASEAPPAIAGGAGQEAQVVEPLEPNPEGPPGLDYTPGPRPLRPAEASPRHARPEGARAKPPLFQGLYGWMILSGLGPALILAAALLLWSSQSMPRQLLEGVPGWKQLSEESAAPLESDNAAALDLVERTLAPHVSTSSREVVQPAAPKRFSSAGLLAVLKTQDWSRGRVTQRDNLSSYTQQNFLYNKGPAQLDVTIYESKNATIQAQLAQRLGSTGHSMSFDNILMHFVPVNEEAKQPLEQLLGTMSRYRTLVLNP